MCVKLEDTLCVGTRVKSELFTESIENDKTGAFKLLCFTAFKSCSA